MENLGQKPPLKNQESNQAFDELYEKILSSDGNYVEYNLPYPKVKFLEYLTKKKNLLIHGSNYDATELIPRQANCRSKKFGNLNAVYATEDSVLPLFYAIKDKQKFNGMAVSGSTEKTLEDGDKETVYSFEIEPEMLKIAPWSEGVAYILARESFEQGVDDEGNLIDEWISRSAVKPMAKIKVIPQDFPYLDKIQEIKE